MIWLSGVKKLSVVPKGRRDDTVGYLMHTTAISKIYSWISWRVSRCVGGYFDGFIGSSRSLHCWVILSHLYLPTHRALIKPAEQAIVNTSSSWRSTRRRPANCILIALGIRLECGALEIYPVIYRNGWYAVAVAINDVLTIWADKLVTAIDICLIIAWDSNILINPQLNVSTLIFG